MLRVSLKLKQKITSLLSEERLKSRCVWRRKHVSLVLFSFFDIWRSLCGSIQRTVLPWGQYMTRGLAVKASCSKVNLTKWNKEGWSPAHLDTGCYWPEVPPVARTACYWCGIQQSLPPALSVMQIPSLIFLEVCLAIRQPRRFEDRNMFVPNSTHSLGIKMEK